MSPRTRTLLATGVLFLVLFAGGGAAGYVYNYHPTRSTLDVRVTSDGGTPAARTVSGTVSNLDGTRLTLATAGGPQTVTLPAGFALDELTHTASLAPGTRVNVGVLSTQYGLVLTGVVAVEGAR